MFLIDQQIRNGSNDVHVKNGDFHCSHLIITVCLRSCACDRVRDLCIYLYLHFTDGSSRKVDFILIQDGNWKLSHCVAFKNICRISTQAWQQHLRLSVSSFVLSVNECFGIIDRLNDDLSFWLLMSCCFLLSIHHFHCLEELKIQDENQAKQTLIESIIFIVALWLIIIYLSSCRSSETDLQIQNIPLIILIFS